jgi:ABC-type transport auxiliary lipoprotein component
MNSTGPGLHAIAFLLTLVAGGCAGSSPPNLYTLSPVGTAGAERSPEVPPAVIAIGSVNLPDYLDRPQIVTRQSAYELQLAPDDRWAAPLYDMVPRVLVEDIAQRLPADRIVSFPEAASPASIIASPVGSVDLTSMRTARLCSRRAGRFTGDLNLGHCWLPTRRCGDPSKTRGTAVTRLRSAPCSPISPTASSER